MKKTLLTLAIASSFSTINTYAASTDNQFDVDDIMVVTASRSTQEKFDVLAAVDVFDRDDIERIQPLSVADLLSRVASISTATTGGTANSTSIFVRGTNSDHVLVLINGVRTGSATLGNKDLSTLSLDLIERVEIVKGPRAALWGADAIGGVIQIFTRNFQPNEGQFGVGLGHDNYQHVYGAIGLGNEQHQYTLTASGQRADGFNISNPFAPNEPDKDGYNNKAIAINGTSEFTDSYSLELVAQLEDGNTEFDSSSFSGDQTDHKNHQILVRNHINLDNAYVQLGYANSREHSYTFGDNKPSSLFETKRNQFNLLSQFNIGQDAELLVGADWYNEKVTSSTIYQENERDVYGLFITGRKQVNDLKLEGSVRYDNVGKVGNETTYQLAAGYQISDQLLVSLNHGSAFKAPSFNELYYPASPFFTGNTDLAPETAKNTELLSKYQSDNYSAELSLYYTDFDDLIATGINAEGIATPINVEKAIIKGIEATVTAELLGASHRLTVSHTDAENKTNHKQLSRRPYFTANYSVSYQADLWDINLDVQYKGKQYNDVASSQKVAAYTLFNLAATYQVTSDLKLSGKLTNLTDKKYQSVLGYNSDGRGFRLGLDYRF